PLYGAVVRGLGGVDPAPGTSAGRPVLGRVRYRGECFFFSSRRRHTRSKRDWSSDVCSSDLGQAWVGRDAGHVPAHVRQRVSVARSEERRVGKECRGRGSAAHQVEKTGGLSLDGAETGAGGPGGGHAGSGIWERGERWRGKVM